MKHTAQIFALFIASAATSAALAQASPACEAKRAAIEAQITQANAQGRTQQVAGLEKALAANKAHCTDAQLAAERDKDIQQALQKVAEREQELSEAQAKGDAEKMAKRRAKLQEAREQLTEAQKPLLPQGH
ncbi:DUF1090 domain-containing protein [Lampropedia puyangensis]|uniref:DUF1090 domain-containing protein n=1 Tax=Lampropedia puyangensis TaxID=1330072 RepID=A0A4S8EWX5_9BURK|nr:DUF1090 domain-containing protein [Lampropedia puyangensis]THT99379.1 DUF1090 domain-containing protein [Lampropedia puyangensis]